MQFKMFLLLSAAGTCCLAPMYLNLEGSKVEKETICPFTVPPDDCNGLSYLVFPSDWQHSRAGKVHFFCYLLPLLHPTSSALDLYRSLALISQVLMLLSHLILTTFGKTQIAMETENINSLRGDYKREKSI